MPFWSRIESLASVVLFAPAAILSKVLVRISMWLLITLGIVVAIFFVCVYLGDVRYATPRDHAYRDLHPESSNCVQDAGWTILAEYKNDELAAIRGRPKEPWDLRLQCSLQRHVVPSFVAPDGIANTDSIVPPDQSDVLRLLGSPLNYYLGFLEFKEDGSPQPLRRVPHDSDGLGQYSALEEHFKKHESNFVIVFIHGWRHDASLGDDNVSNARLYAASITKFLNDRCNIFKEKKHCDVTVTVIYVGWRGARVDEKDLKLQFGILGEWIGTLAAIPTLFDRKPVSEEIGPSVVTALRGLYNVVKSRPGDNHMIVFGHSLGGNLLISTLRDYLIKLVLRHQSGHLIDPPIGDLTVLINPASEAANWTAFQRAVWNRIAYRESEDIPGSTVDDGHTFFRQDQSPVVVSVTSARSWPPAGVRVEDCEWLSRHIHDSNDDIQKRAREIQALIYQNVGPFKNNIRYDWATYDLFPVFKFDFRPFAQTVDRFASRITGWDGPPGNACSSPPAGFWKLVSAPVRLLASVLRNIPCMATDREQTHTIGHLDPPRPPMGDLINNAILPFRPFGTTHEIMGSTFAYQLPVEYSKVAIDINASCPPARSWLWNVRATEIANDKDSHGTFWDSDHLDESERPALHFRHHFLYSGSAAITRANDPFWNVRAFDTVLSAHDGYLVPSFICAMSQLVMDDIAKPSPR